MEKKLRQEKLQMSENNISYLFWKKDKKIKFLFKIIGYNNLMFVGGAVRSAINYESTSDIDLAVSINPSKVKKILNVNNIKFFDNSKGHGTITLEANNYKVEITSLRIDKISYGRKAKVEYTDDFYLDSCRRDFTINAIYADFNGKLYDPHKGAEDLKRNIVKFIGKPEKRISEDHLRILRYFRFVAVLNNKKIQLDKKSLQSCVQKANLIKKISRERINQEFMKLICAKNASFSLGLMKKNNILDLIIEGLNKISYSNIKKIDELEKDPLMRLCFLFFKSRLDKKKLIRDLKKSKKETNLISKICENLKSIKGVAEARKTKYRYGRLVSMKRYMLHLSISKSKPQKRIIEVLNNWESPTFPINGNDVKNIKVSDKRQIGDFIKNIENWWVAQDFKPNRKKCLNKLQRF